MRRNERRGGGPRRGGVATRATSSRSSPSPGRGSRPAARPCPPPLAVVPHERRRGRPRWQPPRPLLRITPRPLTRTFGCDLFSSRFRSHYRRVRRWRAGGGSSGEGRGPAGPALFLTSNHIRVLAYRRLGSHRVLCLTIQKVAAEGDAHSGSKNQQWPIRSGRRRCPIKRDGGKFLTTLEYLHSLFRNH